MKVYVIKDTVGSIVTETFTAVNLMCAVRDLRATVDTDRIRLNNSRLARWDDSILYEYTLDEKMEAKVTNTFVMKDITKLNEAENGKENK